MPRVLNYGSVNIDHVYTVPHVVAPGETLASTSYRRFAGGKGFNQSIALAAAGARVCHAGCIGEDGLWLRDMLNSRGIDTAGLCVKPLPTGHAIIQVTAAGENAIVLGAGANAAVSGQEITTALAGFGPGDVLLVQNEVNHLPAILAAGRERGMHLVLNPAPMDARVLECPLEAIGSLVLNEVEAAQLAGEAVPAAALAALRRRLPGAAIVMTLGPEGALAAEPGGDAFHVPSPRVQAVDTTAAGDTFIGYFIASRLAGTPFRQAIERGCRAAAICVTRRGASDSIPSAAELDT